MGFNKKNKMPLIFIKEKLPIANFNLDDLVQIRGKASIRQITPNKPYWQLVGQMKVELEYLDSDRDKGGEEPDLFSDLDEFDLGGFIKGFPKQKLSSTKDRKVWQGDVNFATKTIVSNDYYWQGKVETEIIDIQLVQEGAFYYLLSLVGVHAEGPLSEEVSEARWWRGLEGDLVRPIKDQNQDILAWRGIVLDSYQEESQDQIEWQGQLLIQVILKDEESGIIQEVWLQEPWGSHWVKEQNIDWESLKGEITELRALNQKTAFTLELTAKEGEEQKLDQNLNQKLNQKPDPLPEGEVQEVNWLKKWMEGSQLNEIKENKESEVNTQFESTLDTWLKELKQESQTGSDVWKQIKEEEEDCMENLKDNNLPEEEQGVEVFSQSQSNENSWEVEETQQNQQEVEEMVDKMIEEAVQEEIDSLLDTVYDQPEEREVEANPKGELVLNEFWNDDNSPVSYEEEPVAEQVTKEQFVAEQPEEQSLDDQLVGEQSFEQTVMEEQLSEEQLFEDQLIDGEPGALEDPLIAQETPPQQVINTKYVDRKKDLSSLGKNMTQWTLYFVNPGESLATIASQYGIDEGVLRSRNKLGYSDNIVAGDLIWILK